VIEKDELLRQSSLALLSNTLSAYFLIFALSIRFWLMNSSPSIFPEAADIPAEALDKLPNNSPADALSMTLGSHQLVQDLL
jgi:hypothetical protein